MSQPKAATSLIIGLGETTRISIMQPLKEQEKTKLWLSQFDNRPGDFQLAEKLLDSINYCPFNEFKNSLAKLVKGQLPPKSTSAIFIERELQPTKAKLPPPHLQTEENLQPHIEEETSAGLWRSSPGHKIPQVQYPGRWERNANDAYRKYTLPHQHQTLFTSTQCGQSQRFESP